ncbi:MULTISPECIES: hypothetical protein [unclassified Fibrobacter]|uniref:hypothetical protein n=1 Tax=unclassified Fibrobacter TaxID=2634177 RepID=UPI000934A8AE|nr:MULTISPECIES: hypothetical protein [unclassified Fibrobacter]OWV06112.1 hypothetical protein B7993_06010 [Fibrobacter sp. UWH3]OWV15595.1 hypothetical protein B7992_04220 [Fibrobacter sp. UWH1]
MKFTETIASDSLSEELFFNLALNGLFSFYKDEEPVPFVYYVKYYLWCNDDDGGQSGDLIFQRKDFWLFLRRTKLIWM